MISAILNCYVFQFSSLHTKVQKNSYFCPISLNFGRKRSYGVEKLNFSKQSFWLINGVGTLSWLFWSRIKVTSEVKGHWNGCNYLLLVKHCWLRKWTFFSRVEASSAHKHSPRLPTHRKKWSNLVPHPCSFYHSRLFSKFWHIFILSENFAWTIARDWFPVVGSLVFCMPIFMHM